MTGPTVYLLSRQLNWIAVLAWNVVVLYVAFGFRQFSHFYTDAATALRAGDLPRARAVIARWREQMGDTAAIHTNNRGRRWLGTS